MAPYLFLVGDLFLFVTTSLVFSVTCLCILIQVRAKDRYSKDFFSILVPLVCQMGINLIVTYMNRALAPEFFATALYHRICLFASLASIILTSVLLYTLSRYLIRLLPEDAGRKKIGYRIVNVIVLVFLLGSLYAILAFSRNDWVLAMELTLGYHFLFGSFLMSAHGIASLFYVRKASTREEESLIRGIAIVFIPLFVTFPLDVIFFKEHSFKLAYLSFSALVVYLYFFISRNYFRQYEPAIPRAGATKAMLMKSGLSDREAEIAVLLLEGQTNSDIGKKLFISINTVKSHIKSIYKKLNVANRIQLIHLVAEGHSSARHSDIGSPR